LSALMLRRAHTRALAPASLALASLALAALASPAPSAASGLGFTACPTAQGFACGTLPVPLDRGGGLPGTLTLSLERRLSGAQPSRDAVVVLAGGPGQAALPLGEFAARALAPALASRDLLLFDQRGTGSSDPLQCAALEQLSVKTLAALYEQCALELGPTRGAFTSAESVEDLETVRQAAGYEKLVLYATSYGTKVALQYAQRYPQRVEALVLDSVVPAAGKEPFQVSTFEAIRPVLGEVCSHDACAGITVDPVADVARLAAQLRRHALRGAVYDGSGRRHAVTLGEPGLFGILMAGDLNPALRALLPAAVRSALANDPDPLLRLELLSEGLIPNAANATSTAGAESSPQIDEALFATTSCEETPFPWQRTASPATRLAEAVSALHAQPAAALYPFDYGTALQTSLVEECARWPDASPPPPAPGALPDVPTLLLSGSQDLRTPTANAQAVAGAIGGAQLLVVPFTGHSVIGSDLSGCATRALSVFFAGGAVQPCPAMTDPFAPTPITPTRLSAVHPPHELGGLPGKTLVAVLDTLVDLNRQVIGATIQADRELPAGSSFGGLRGGYARLSSSALLLRHFAFVPGVQLTGSFPVSGGRLQAASIRITGSAAAHGTVRVGSGLKRASGTLAGKSFSIDVASVRLSRRGGGDWPSAAAVRRLLGPAR
jgi:pimeloyl-ACP methyl ester carboxylesterase